jgi:hypothetical protein
MTNTVLDAIRTRRMTRAMTDRRIERDRLEAVLEAARWAPNAGYRRLHRFIAVSPRTLRLPSGRLAGHVPASVAPWYLHRLGSGVSFGMRRAPEDHMPTSVRSRRQCLLAAHSLGLARIVVALLSWRRCSICPADESGDRVPRTRPQQRRCARSLHLATLTDWGVFSDAGPWPSERQPAKRRSVLATFLREPRYGGLAATTHWPPPGDATADARALVGHGSPMNAIEDNRSRAWARSEQPPPSSYPVRVRALADEGYDRRDRDGPAPDHPRLRIPRCAPEQLLTWRQVPPGLSDGE